MITRWSIVLLAPAVLCGCTKTVTVVFVNQTAHPKALEIDSPGQPKRYLGVMPAGGGTIRVKISADPKLLPADVRWRAGHTHRGSFPLDEQTEKNLRIDVLPGGPTAPYKWKGKIRR